MLPSDGVFYCSVEAAYAQHHLPAERCIQPNSGEGQISKIVYRYHSCQNLFWISVSFAFAPQTTSIVTAFLLVLCHGNYPAY